MGPSDFFFFLPLLGNAKVHLIVKKKKHHTHFKTVNYFVLRWCLLKLLGHIFSNDDN